MPFPISCTGLIIGGSSGFLERFALRVFQPHQLLKATTLYPISHHNSYINSEVFQTSSVRTRKEAALIPGLYLLS